MALFFVLGLTWLFGGLVVAAPGVVALQYLFAILNTLQGVAMFYFQCFTTPVCG